MLHACRELRATTLPNGLPAGQAVATVAGELPARWVIHTVGPVYDPVHDRSEVLAMAYAASLAVADELGARSVAFPAISTGAYGWPMVDAAGIAARAVAAAETRVELVRFVLISEKPLAIFTRAVAAATGTVR